LPSVSIPPRSKRSTIQTKSRSSAMLRQCQEAQSIRVGSANRTTSDWSEVHRGPDGRAVSRLPSRTFLGGTPETGFILILALPFITEAKEFLAV
jgi:hypothetical protein